MRANFNAFNAQITMAEVGIKPPGYKAPTKRKFEQGERLRLNIAVTIIITVELATAELYGMAACGIAYLGVDSVVLGKG